MGTVYTKPLEGEWIQPSQESYRLGCCDCGLVHRMEFRVHGGRVQFRAWRDERATGQKRRQQRRFQIAAASGA